MEALRRALDERGLTGVRIMAKIENRGGVERLDEILEAADQICIAGGTWATPSPCGNCPACRSGSPAGAGRRGRPFCLVTQLLWSMEQRPVPTRAEVCDIYNGVLDGADSLMLTGETAAGAYPVQAMEYLVKTARTALADL